MTGLEAGLFGLELEMIGGGGGGVWVWGIFCIWFCNDGLDEKGFVDMAGGGFDRSGAI